MTDIYTSQEVVLTLGPPPPPDLHTTQEAVLALYEPVVTVVTSQIIILQLEANPFIALPQTSYLRYLFLGAKKKLLNIVKKNTIYVTNPQPLQNIPQQGYGYGRYSNVSEVVILALHN